MKKILGPSQLTMIGVVGTACFVAVAVIGVTLKPAGPPAPLVPSNVVAVNPPPRPPPPAAPLAKIVEPAAPPPSVRTVEPAPPPARIPELAAPPTKAVEAAPPPSHQEPAPDIVEFLNGSFSDLLRETERLQADFDSDVANDPKTVVVKLRALARRTQLTFTEFSVLLGKPIADGRERIDATPLTNFGSSLVALVRTVQALKEDDQEGYRSLINDPTRARFDNAAGGLSLWIDKTRATMAGSQR